MANMAGDNVVYIAKLHWLLFLWPGLLTAIGLFLGIQVEQLKEVALVIVIIGVIWLLITWVHYHFSSLVIKKKQVLLRKGVLVRQTVDIPLNKIESINISQSLLGSIFNYGSITIIGTGGTKQDINFLNKPLTCRRYIEQLMNAD
ncbi:transmembrane protein [Legionella beliardensis]|uniref:Transmembrane protein n=2 Tax=Legionella beliardensis TaxID=91822 RepID=A0A378I4Q4_9GAMM|nr:transmembrane protein [Legionella beliardensis]